MSNLVSGSCFIQEIISLRFGFVFIGLAVAAHTAHSEEGSFAPNPDRLTIQLVSSDTDWQLPYRHNTNVALAPAENSTAIGLRFSNTSRLLLVPVQEKEAVWSIKVGRQITSDSNCPPLSSFLCFESKEELLEITPRRDPVWLVWRKVLPF